MVVYEQRSVNYHVNKHSHSILQYKDNKSEGEEKIKINHTFLTLKLSNTGIIEMAKTTNQIIPKQNAYSNEK